MLIQFFFQISYLASVYVSEQLSEESCSALGFVTHYLYLCQFSWMLIQVSMYVFIPLTFMLKSIALIQFKQKRITVKFYVCFPYAHCVQCRVCLRNILSYLWGVGSLIGKGEVDLKFDESEMSKKIEGKSSYPRHVSCSHNEAGRAILKGSA